MKNNILFPCIYLHVEIHKLHYWLAEFINARLQVNSKISTIAKKKQKKVMHILTSLHTLKLTAHSQGFSGGNASAKTNLRKDILKMVFMS